MVVRIIFMSGSGSKNHLLVGRRKEVFISYRRLQKCLQKDQPSFSRRRKKGSMLQVPSVIHAKNEADAVTKDSLFYFHPAPRDLDHKGVLNQHVDEHDWWSRLIMFSLALYCYSDSPYKTSAITFSLGVLCYSGSLSKTRAAFLECAVVPKCFDFFLFFSL